MELFASITHNLLTPAILFFVLGVLSGIIKSDLEFPDAISRFLVLYLMVAIGFKGGASLAGSSTNDTVLWLAIGSAVAIGSLQPFFGYWLLRKTTRLDVPTSAAVAAHYGSTSMVTFITALAFLNQHNVPYAGYIIAILAVLEIPAILTGLYIANRQMTSKKSQKPRTHLLREIATNGTIVLLIGAFAIGALTGDAGMQVMHGLIVDPFQGLLALFLLDMGLHVSRQLHLIRGFTASLVAFGIYMPLIGATLGITVAQLIGLDAGSATLFTVLIASASYIAVPAAMRFALPQANAAIYVPMALGVTFPFNVTIGIPLYFQLIQAWWG